MQDQQRGVVAILAADTYPLLDPANRDIALLNNAARLLDRQLCRNFSLTHSPLKQERCGNQNQRQHYCKYDPSHRKPLNCVYYTQFCR